MKKRICRLLLAFLLVLVFCVSMAAAEQTGAQLSCVTDTAGLLSESEIMLLEKMAESVSQKYGVGVYIVTVEDYRDFHSEGVYKATYTIYHQYTMGVGPNRDGIMLLLSMADRDWAMFCYAEHIIGGAGHLYCIVPVDENATVVINRVQWNEKTKTDEVTDVLYRSESGEPVLLFANLDGIAYEADTQVFITDNNGNTCEWYPSLDAMSHLAPCISEAGDYLSFDFTEYAWYNAPPEFADWLSDGWTGMTALGLAGSQRSGMGWITETMVGETNRYACFSLRFYPGDETGGSVDLDWAYKGSKDFEEMWSGSWTIQTIPDGPSYVTINISLVGGKNYGVTDGPMYLCETYPLLISPSGTELLIGAGESGICLPFMSQSTLACVLTQSAG